MSKKAPLAVFTTPLKFEHRVTARAQVSASLRGDAGLSSKVESLPEALRNALLDKVALEIAKAQQIESTKGTGSPRVSASAARARLKQVIREVPVDIESRTVGVLDLGARVGKLALLLQKLNSGQHRFVFFDVHGPVPAGLTKSPEHIRAWVEASRQAPLTNDETVRLTSAMLMEDVLHVAEVTRAQAHFDMLVCISPVMLAQETDHGPEWDLHAGGQDNVCVVSTFNLRTYASQANRPFEAALGLLIVGQVLTWAAPELNGYHAETRGCVLDNNEDPAEIVVSIRAMTIEPSCQAKFQSQSDAEAASAMLKALRLMRGVAR